MIIKHGTDWRGNAKREFSLREAIKHKLTPEPYSYTGQLERVEEMISLQATMLADMVEALNLNHEQVQNVLGSEFKVEP